MSKSQSRDIVAVAPVVFGGNGRGVLASVALVEVIAIAIAEARRLCDAVKGREGNYSKLRVASLPASYRREDILLTQGTKAARQPHHYHGINHTTQSAV